MAKRPLDPRPHQHHDHRCGECGDATSDEPLFLDCRSCIERYRRVEGVNLLLYPDGTVESRCRICDRTVATLTLTAESLRAIQVVES